MASASTLKRDVLTSVVGYAVPPALALITQILLARSLGVDGRGQVAGAIAPMLLAATVATLGIPESITHHLASHGRTPRVLAAIRRAFFTLVLTGLVITALFVALQLASASPGQEREIAVIAMSALTPLLILAAFRGFAAGEYRWRLIAADRILGASLGACLVTGLILSHGLSVVSATVVAAFMPIPAILIYVSLARPSRPPSASGDLDLRFHGYGIRLWFGALAGILLLRLDQVLLTPLAGAKELGLYVVAVPISEGLLIVNSALRDVLFARQSENPHMEDLAKATRISTAFTLLSGLALGILSAWLVPLLYGKQFAGAVPVLFLLIAASVIGNPGSLAGAGLSARGRPELRSVALVAALAVNIIAMVLLVPELGAVGAGIASLISYPLSGWLALIFMKRIYGARVGDFVVPKRTDLREIRRLLAFRGSA